MRLMTDCGEISHKNLLINSPLGRKACTVAQEIGLRSQGAAKQAGRRALLGGTSTDIQTWKWECFSS
jgi:hypothetical protein